MSTIIYPSPIFGPVHSRRLGVSLGINLLPADGKVCTFDCIYCECGFNADHRPKIHDALMKVDNNIQKLDTIDPLYINKVDRPEGEWYQVDQVIEGLKRFQGHVIIQTMFLKGTPTPPTPNTQHPTPVNYDNTGEEYVAPWLEAVKAIAPQQVMIYTIDRETPMQGLQKATHEELDRIRDRVLALGIPCTASY